MSVSMLMEEFTRLLAQSGSASELRRWVLKLAIKGRLVTQEADDGDASELLLECTEVRERLGATRAAAARSLAQAGSFTLPENWTWARLEDIASFSAGRTPSRSDPSYWDSPDHHWVSIADLPDGGEVVTTKESVSDRARQQVFNAEPCAAGTMLMSFKLTIGKIARLAVPAFHNEAIVAVRPYVAGLDPYLFLILPEQARQGATKGAIKGLTLNRASLSGIKIPLPPLREQQRIVAKVGALMALCDELEAAQTDREARRQLLRSTSLRNLVAPDDSKDSAGFFLRHSPRMITAPEHVPDVRQAILNLAVRGRLAGRDASDEAARVHLARGISVTPPAFRRVPLITLGRWAIGSGFPKTEQGCSAGPYPFLKVSDMNLPGNERWITTANNYVDDAAIKRMSARLHPPGTIIFPKIGGAIATNKRRILTAPSVIDNNCLGITFAPDLSIAWCYLLLTSLDFAQYQVGTAVPALQQGVLGQILVDVPPREAQDAAVAQVEQLMSVCDELERSLATEQTERSRLLEALLRDALEVGLPSRRSLLVRV